MSLAPRSLVRTGVRAVALLALGVPAPGSGQVQRSEDPYTRYELQAPGSGAFRIIYDVTAAGVGQRWYFNGIRAGAEEEVHGVTDLASGRALPWELVDGAVARERGVPGAGAESHYIQVTLRDPVAPGSETRIRIDKTYVDPESYFDDGGEVVFDRTLGIARNAVVLPAGFELVSVNLPSQVDTEADGRIRVSFLNPSGETLRYRVRARPLPEAAARALAGPVERPSAGPGSGRRGGYDGTYARTDRAFPERAAQTREIVYFLEHPSTHAFRLYHDYTEERAGVDRYLNVVRAGSRAFDPRAFALDTGAELPVETVIRAEDDAQVVVIPFEAPVPPATVRLRIHETYVDSARYRDLGEELVWDRNFGRSRNQVVLPQGWFLTASDQPAVVDALDDGRTRLTFWDGGPDGVQVFARARVRRPAAATSLFGEPLHPRPHPDPTVLTDLVADLAAAPDDVEAVIALARELRNAFRYDEAIALYDRAVALAPDDWRPWRFRGHRRLSTRRFADGVSDLERARELAPFNFDVAYHLGLAYYLAGRFDESADEYGRCVALAADADALARDGAGEFGAQRTCMSMADSDDTRVAIEEWRYRALRRAGRHDEARELAASIPVEMEVSANGAYHQALLAHAGRIDPALLVLPFPPEGRFETRAYGVAVDEWFDGDRERALLLLRRVAADPHWPGFGRLAAEADLARLNGGAP
ncbi:MAG: tetratricopeptide repeat protein [Longimicrobiales bacterium]